MEKTAARVAGKVALVTGAASGLGEGAARFLAREGARVMVTDINVEGGEAVAQSIGEAAVFMKHDAASENDWKAVLAATLKRFGKLDILVNNAGVPTAELIEETTLDRWRSVMSLNLDGVFLGVKHGILAMKETGGGSIVNISSVAGLVGTARTGTYSASKGGVRLLTKCAALECAQLGYNIRVNSVHPGIIETPPTAALFTQLGDGDEEAGRRMIVGLTPLGRMGHVDDIANAIVYLASDESTFMTGSELVIDGGMTAQ